MVSDRETLELVGLSSLKEEILVPLKSLQMKMVAERKIQNWSSMDEMNRWFQLLHHDNVLFECVILRF